MRLYPGTSPMSHQTPLWPPCRPVPPSPCRLSLSLNLDLTLSLPRGVPSPSPWRPGPAMAPNPYRPPAPAALDLPSGLHLLLFHSPVRGAASQAATFLPTRLPSDMAAPGTSLTLRAAQPLSTLQTELQGAIPPRLTAHRACPPAAQSSSL